MIFRIYGAIFGIIYAFFKVDMNGLNVIQNAPHNYLVPGITPLNIQGRVVGSGVTVFNIKF